MSRIFHIRPVSVGLEKAKFCHFYLYDRETSGMIVFRTFVVPLVKYINILAKGGQK